MDDSISRQDACRTLFDDCHIKIMSGNNWIRLEEAVAKLSALPSAQPELTEQDMREEFSAGYDCGMEAARHGIIMCNECKHYEADIMGNPWGVCCHQDWVIGNCGSDVDEKGWCYRAERRTDETD